jgi:hypothetical protein
MLVSSTEYPLLERAMFMEENTKRFLETEVERARKAGVICDFPHQTHLAYPQTGTEVNGYFIEIPFPKCAAAIGKPIQLWLPIALHEFCHMDQYLEQSSYWEDRLLPGSTIEAAEILMLWVQKKIELSEEQRREYITRARDVELDCEMRAVEKIKKFGLPLSIPEYIKKANSYLFFYTAMEYLQRWYLPDREPYNVPEVWKHAPDVFLPEHAYACFGCIPRELLTSYYEITMTCCGR